MLKTSTKAGLGQKLNEVGFYNPAIGEKTVLNGQTLLRSGFYETDPNEVDSTLVPLFSRVLSGTDIFSETLGATGTDGSGVTITIKDSTSTVYRTTDNGETPSAISTPRTLYGRSRDSIGFGNGNIFIAAVGDTNWSGLVKSINGGVGWSSVQIEAANVDFFNVFWVEADTWLAVNANGQIWRTTDANSFSVVDTQAGDIVVGFVRAGRESGATHDRILAIGTDGYIRHSDDGGATWTKFDISATSLQSIFYLGDRATDEHTIVITRKSEPSLISFGNGGNGTWAASTVLNAVETVGRDKSCTYGDGNGTGIIALFKDATTCDFYQTTDYMATIEPISSLVNIDTSEALNGMVIGQDNRLFFGNSTAGTVTYGYIDFGYGIPESNIGGAVGYVRIK